MQLDVHFLPTSRTADDVANRTVVVIDVLRATTTILCALAAGAREVIPCLEVDEATEVARRIGGDVILGGERGGKPIPGFTFGNSPSEYTPQSVAGRTLVFTTTNGTRAMQMCQRAARVWVGAFVNLSQLVVALERADQVALLCAGTNDRITREDVLFAGAVIGALRERAIHLERMNDESELALAAWESTAGAVAVPEQFTSALAASRGGRNLVELGYENDIRLAAQIDACPVLGEFVMNEGRIVTRSITRS